jgi:hypothetical protein
MGRLPERLRCVAGKAERAVEGHDGTDQVRPLGAETDGDLPTPSNAPKPIVMAPYY